MSDPSCHDDRGLSRIIIAISDRGTAMRWTARCPPLPGQVIDVRLNLSPVE